VVQSSHSAIAALGDCRARREWRDVMDIDDDFIKKFQSQIFLLENMEKAVKEAIGNAKNDLKLLKANHGKNIEDVIRPEKPKR
jgi:hypothetical protein